MTNFRFLHCADLHLDSPLRGLEADPSAPAEDIRGATRQAFRNLVDFAINENVDFVVAAGDLYDGDWQDWRTGHFLIGQVARLSNAGIAFIAIRGNHDADSVITKQLRMPGTISRWLDHLKPETYLLPNLPVAIHGQSFATRAVTENIALAYPPPDPERFNIGLLHSSAGERDGHDTYASCSIDQLRAHGYDYWALGHVHAREELSRDPWIVFPGNLQGRHINETGPKGATLVTVAGGRVQDVSHMAFDTVRWARITVHLANDSSEDDALTSIRTALTDALENTEGRLLAVRITLTGAGPVHDLFMRDMGAAQEKIRAEALAVSGPERIWTEKIVIETSPVTAVTAREFTPGASGRLIQALTEMDDGQINDDVLAYANGLLGKVNPLRQAIGGIDVPGVVARARALLLGALECD